MARTSLESLMPRAPGGVLGRVAADTEPDRLPCHVGLWLDRVVSEPAREPRRPSDGAATESRAKDERKRLFLIAIDALRPGATASDDPPAVMVYRHLYARWRSRIERDAPGFVRRTVQLEARSRILLHPASGETVTEGSLLIHHSYGVPYLPGSGLKGVLRSRLKASVGEKEAGELLGRQGEDDDDLASAIDVLDALWVPERPPGLSAEWSPLALDVVTPHHPDYYTVSGGRRRLPTDRDQPTPVHRLTIAPGARFLMTLEAADGPGAREWLDRLVDSVLLPALEHDGFGAWTSVGYGRLSAVGATAVSDDRAKEAPSAERTQVAVVVRNPGSGILSAVLADGRRAEASRDDAERLLAGLPDGLQAKLRGKKKSARLRVKIEAIGTSWRLVDLAPLEP